VNIEEDILKISYKKPEDDDTLHPGTIHRGLARRSFDLGYKISAKYDLSKAEAKLENGLLEIAIPISEKAKPKTLKFK
jgi:HSP20 family molecular chaperone IbpA